MDLSPSLTSTTVLRECKVPLLSSYPVIRPTETNLSLKNLKNAVDFHPKEKSSCENIWYRDVKSTHIRNKHLLDLHYKKPRCCFEIYNTIRDRQKLKKIQKYELTRPVRTRIRPEVEKVKTCDAKQTTQCSNVTYVPECCEIKESSSDEESDGYESCKSETVNECSECLGKTRMEMHKIIKKDFGELLHSKEEFCKEKVAEELKIHKLGENFELKLNKVF